jgi:hypothetical protein
MQRQRCTTGDDAAPCGVDARRCAARAEIRAEAEPTARFCAPDASVVEVMGV